MKKSILDECLRIAIRLNPTHPEWSAYHHFSFIIQNNSIIEHATNRGGGVKPLIGYAKHQKLHSENRVFFKAKGLLNKNKSFDVVNIRLSKKDELKISRPCKCCISFLKFLGCSTVWFTTELGFAKLRL
jgi:hypothetical protein